MNAVATGVSGTCAVAYHCCACKPHPDAHALTTGITPSACPPPTHIHTHTRTFTLTHVHRYIFLKRFAWYAGVSVSVVTCGIYKSGDVCYGRMSESMVTCGNLECECGDV